MLKNILNTLSNNKKTILYFIIFFVAFFALFDLASANTGTQSASDARFEQMKQTASIILELGTKIIVAFLSLITFLAALFLSPEWYNGSIFGLNGYFKEIWIIVSNFVYFVFAFILIWIAFMNIIGKGQDKYALKQALPKFVVGIFIVPISWFLVQFTLSVVTVLSIAALNFPFDTFKKFDTDVSKIEISTNCTLNLSDLKNINGNNSDPKKYFSCEGDKKEVGDYLKSNKFTDGIFGIVAVYTYGILNLEEISGFTAQKITNIKTISDLGIKLLFDFIFIVIYSVLMIALGLVLFTRGIYLWVYIMISPVFGLMYFFGKGEGGGDGFFAKFNLKEFLSLAMVPVYTMLALSLGLLFLYVIGQGITDNTSGSNFFKIDDSGTGATLTVGDNQTQLTITGAPEASKSLSFLGSLGNQSLGIVGTLIMKIFGVVVLWMAVMAALSSSKITREIIKPLKDFGDQVGSLASKAPQYAPIFGGQSMTSMSQIGATATSHFENKARERGTTFLQEKGLFGQNAQTESKAANALTELRNTQGLNKSSVTRFSEALHEFKDSQQAANSKSMVEASKILAEKLGIGEDHYKNIDGNRDNFSMLMSMIDAELDKGGNSYGNLFTNRDRNINHNEFIGAVLDTYLSENSGKAPNPGTPNQSNAFSFNIHNNNKLINGNGMSLVGKLNDDSEITEFTGNNDYREIGGYIKSFTSKENLASLLGNLGVAGTSNTEIINKLKEYYNNKGEFIEGGNQTGGRFPWEPNSEESN